MTGHGTSMLLEVSQSLTSQPEHGPLLQRNRSELLIEVDGRLIPIEHAPLHAAIIPLACDSRQLLEQRHADSLPPKVGLYEHVFQVQSRLTQEGRVVGEEQ